MNGLANVTDTQVAGSEKQRGLTLLEALIAILVLSFGLLGLAAMQAQGIKLNSDAYGHTQATLLAYDIIDRIRNNGSADTESYHFPEDQASELVFADTCVWAVASVENDIDCWEQQIQTYLGESAFGTINIDVASSEHFITIQWEERAVRADTPSQDDTIIRRRAQWEFRI